MTGAVAIYLGLVLSSSLFVFMAVCLGVRGFDREQSGVRNAAALLPLCSTVIGFLDRRHLSAGFSVASALTYGVLWALTSS